MDKKEILHYLKTSSEDETLFQKADYVRKRYCGDEVHIRGIIEFSNHCCRSCLYCGLRKENKKLKRYRMSEDEIVALALRIASYGVKTIVLQSGDDFYYSRSMICNIVQNIKKEADVAITLSIGERPLDDYRAFKDSGTDRYLLKHETVNEKLYKRLHPGQSLKKRLKILEHLKKLGYQTGAGNIVGLPGQTLEDLCEDILFFKKFDPDMIGIGPFIPQKDTPLSTFPQGSFLLTLKVLALTRITTLNSHIPATTALATVEPDGQFMGLKAGANVIMPDFTPSNYRKNYTIYDNKAHITLEKAKETIFKAGKIISTDKGHSLKRLNESKYSAIMENKVSHSFIY